MKNALNGFGLICFCLIVGAFSAQAWANCTLGCKVPVPAYLLKVGDTFKCVEFVSGEGCTDFAFVNGGTAMQFCNPVGGSQLGEWLRRECDAGSCTTACIPDLANNHREATFGTAMNCGDNIAMYALECKAMAP